MVELAVIAVFVAFVAVPAVAAFRFATCVVLETVNGAVPVATVEVITPEAEMVVNAPVGGVVAPTVPLMLIDAVPVRLVTVPDDGVPKAPPFTTNEPAVPMFVPSAVSTPVPVVVVDGATPAPPPMTNAFAASAALDAIVVEAEKYGIPPLVPLVIPVPPEVTGTVLSEMTVPDTLIGEVPVYT